MYLFCLVEQLKNLICFGKKKIKQKKKKKKNQQETIKELLSFIVDSNWHLYGLLPVTVSLNDNYCSIA